eukprot:jgi/Tetstr1/443598/TSEL_031597.t1
MRAGKRWSTAAQRESAVPPGTCLPGGQLCLHAGAGREGPEARAGDRPREHRREARYRQFAAELKEQNKKDGKTFGEMFSRGDLYTAEEVEKMKKEAGSGTVLGEMDEASKALAKQMGIDLNDPRVRAELARLEAAKKAKDASGGAGAGAAEPREQHWWIKATLKYKWVVYFLIALHITWRMWVAISSLPVHRAQLAREVGGNSMWDGANASTMSGMARSGDAFDEL